MSTTITDLPNATTPLSGTERVPMDQAGATKDASTQDIANLAPGTDLTYTAATRTLASSTGADVVLPEATTSAAGLMAAADKTRIDELGATDSPSFAGLTITGTAAVAIPHIHGSIAGNFYIHVRNTTGGSLTAGTAVYAVGSVGNTDRIEVAACDPTNPAKMPAIAVLETTLASNGDGDAVVLGELRPINTSAYTLGDQIYVGASGALVATIPASGEVQSIGAVARVNANTGTIVVQVSGAMARVGFTGAYADLSGTPTVPAAADATPQPLGTAAVGASVDYAREDHVHAMPSAAGVGADPAGTAAAAVAAHEAAANPHPGYLTAAEGNAAYATAAQGALAATAVQPGAIGSSGLTMGAGLLGRETGTGAIGTFSIGSGLAVVSGALVVTTASLATNLSWNASTREVISSTGTNATLTTATTTLAGLQSAADKVKLNGIATGATANETDPYLLSRANHTGSQLASTISDLAASVRAQTLAQLVAGTNITLTPSGTGGTQTLTIAAAGSGAGTDLSYTASTRLLESSTGADVTLPLMSSTAAGLVPASGGGTSNFLRADGTFAAPPSGGSTPDVYVAGNWINPVHSAAMSAGAALTAGTIAFFPFVLLRSVTVNELGAAISTASAGSSFEIAIYESSGVSPVGAPLAVTGSLSGATVTTVSASVTPFNLNANQVYFMAALSDGSPVFRAIASTSTWSGSIMGNPTLNGLLSGGNNNQILQLAGQSLGGWPTLTAGQANSTNSTNRMAIVFLKVSALL